MDLTGLILEGVCGAGKSAALQALQAAPAFQGRGFSSLLCLTEHHTQRVLEPLEESGELEKDDHLDLLGGIVDFLEGRRSLAARHDWSARGRTAHRFGFLLERFHLTHAVQYPHLDWSDLEKIDARLGELNCKLAILTVPPETLRDRLFSPARDESWFAYLRTVAADDAGIVRHYVSQQEKLLELAAGSRLPGAVFDAARNSPAELAAQLLEFWLED